MSPRITVAGRCGWGFDPDIPVHATILPNDGATGDRLGDIVAALFLVLLALPWAALHWTYVGIIDPSAFSEQGRTVRRARVYLGWPATIALCWAAAKWWLDTPYDLVIVIYAAVLVRLVLFAANLVGIRQRDLWWIDRLLVAPAAAYVALVLPPLVVTALGRAMGAALG